jgi:hypothetical protein
VCKHLILTSSPQYSSYLEWGSNSAADGKGNEELLEAHGDGILMTTLIGGF